MPLAGVIHRGPNGAPCAPATAHEKRQLTTMQQPPNGVSAASLPGLTWQKSRHSNPSGNCVEVAALPTGGVAVRNSRDPEGPALIYTSDEIAAFIAGARDGEFDHLLP